MASPKTKKKSSKKTAAKTTTAKKKVTKRAPAAAKRAPAAAKRAPKAEASKTITATVTLTGEPAELKACVEDIVEAAKKVIEKELRQQIRQS